MQQLALLALDDGDVDLLARVRQRDDLRLEAVYHPDPSSLVWRLAELARLPVFTDLRELDALPLDFCVVGEGALATAAELAGKSARAGRPAPVFVPVAELDDFLKDPAAWQDRSRKRDGGATPAPPVEAPAAAAEAVAETPAAVAPPAAPASAAPAVEPPAAPSAPPVASEPPPAPPSSAAPAAASPPVAVARPSAPPGDESPVAAPPPPATPPVARPPEAAPAEPPPAVTVESPPPPATLGVPSIDLFYDPARLTTWLAEAAARLAGGSSAVIWRREADGQRYTLLAYAPDTDALPTIPFPPAQLEGYVRADRAQVLSSDHLLTRESPAPAFLFLALPLPGQEGPFGLLGVFRPARAGAFPREAVAELSSRAGSLGPALERCFHFARLGQELKGLRFKERIRDLMLEGNIAEADRWSRLLSFLLDEVRADVAQFYKLADNSLRLMLVSAASRSGEFEGWVSIPVGHGHIGAAIEREGISVYSSQDAADARQIYLLPLRALHAGRRVPIGIIVLDGASSQTEGGGDTAGLLENLGGILSPLLPAPTVPGGP